MVYYLKECKKKKTINNIIYIYFKNKVSNGIYYVKK